MATPTKQTTLIRSARPSPPWSPPNLLVSTLAVVVVTAIAGAAAQPVRLAPAPAPQTFQPPNLLTSTLQSQDQMTVGRLTDWPNPQPRPASARTWTQSRPIFAADLAPKNQYDWPNPPQPSLFVTTTSVQMTDDADRAFSQHRWPNPPLIPAPALTWTQNLLQTTLAPVTADPFRPIAWPNPAAQPAPVRTWTQTRPIFAVDQSPKNQTDWPNPRVIASPTRTFISYYVPDTNLPFSQQDWQNPLRQAVPARSWIHLPPPVVAAQELPFRQTDWPLPTVAHKSALSFAQEHKPTTTDTILVRQISWPLPAPRVHQITLLTWTQPRPQFYTDLKPFLQSDWPNPRLISIMREYGSVGHLEPSERPPITTVGVEAHSGIGQKKPFSVGGELGGGGW